jgi:hypothetical protein
LVSRIDLFTSSDCQSCPRAREVVTAFAAEHPDVEVREWDLATNPGPAVGRGIFATPSLLLNGVDVLLGVPTKADLLKRFGPDLTRSDTVDPRFPSVVQRHLDRSKNAK